MIESYHCPKVRYETLAPISISVYDRLSHIRKCVESLKENSLAKYSVLYIFSDAPKTGDEATVSEVRSYINNITGFRDVVVKEQKFNSFEKNMRDARSVPLQKHGNMIRLEDDVYVSSSFLKFMNEALAAYEEDEKVFGILGAVHPANESYGQPDAKAFRCFNASGIGLWKSKVDKFWCDYEELHPYRRLRRSPRYLVRFIRTMGFRRVRTLRMLYKKGNFQGDRLFGEYVFRKEMLMVFPPITLTVNRGNDGSGVHCKFSPKKQMQGALKPINSIKYPKVFSEHEVYSETNLYIRALSK